MTKKKRILAASDIHGYGHVLMELLKKANYSPEEDQLILLGDYINKGPNSLGTLEFIRNLREEGAIVLVGNNELKWLNLGGGVVKEWEAFIRSLSYVKKVDSFLFVHAGLKKDVPLHEQKTEDLTGMHDFQPERYENEIVVFGHTPTFRLGAEHGRVWLSEGLIGIDTGAGHGYHLSLIDLTNWKVWMKDTSGSREVETYNIDRRIVVPEGDKRKMVNVGQYSSSSVYDLN